MTRKTVTSVPACTVAGKFILKEKETERGTAAVPRGNPKREEWTREVWRQRKGGLFRPGTRATGLQSHGARPP